ncbi:MAG: DUF971 domain-containing protein [Marinagarivorans sp.]|nr:DUF971 domain-containing protein [Marinagarivorans sp.]
MKPHKIHLHKNTQILDIEFHNLSSHLSAEFLRVHSPSAEVKGHQGMGGELPYGKKNIRINKIEAAGNYALKITFDDGHDSGLYTWTYLHELATQSDSKWQVYLEQLYNAHKSRDPEVAVIQFKMPS